MSDDHEHDDPILKSQTVVNGPDLLPGSGRNSLTQCSICGRGFAPNGEDPLEDVFDILKSAENDWEYLDDEERHGTVVEARQLVEAVLDE